MTGIIDLFGSHSYLAITLAMLPLSLILNYILLPQKQRIAGFMSGIFNTPFCLGVILLEFEYWNPTRIGGMLLGIEDVLISFEVGNLAWTLAAFPFSHRLSMDFKWQKAAQRYLFAVTCGLIIYLPMLLTDLDHMTIFIINLFCLTCIFLVIRRKLWPLVLSGTFAFLFFYAVLLKTILLIWPDFATVWNNYSYWGKQIFGLPAGEITWAFVWGGALPAMSSYFMDVRLKNLEYAEAKTAKSL